MTKRPWFDAEGRIIREPGERLTIPHTRGDLPDFVSPIDGRVWSGRAGLREHCKIHDVVPTADLAGLPPKLSATTPKIDREEIRQTIADVINSKGY